MKQEHTTQRHRLVLVSAGFLFVATFLCIRLAQKQVIEHQTYQALAKGQQYEQKELVAKRGQILLKDGVGSKTYPAATNQTTYAINVVPSQIIDKRQVAERLALVTDLATDFVFEQINNNKLYIPPIKRKVSYDESRKVEDLKIDGVYLTPEEIRFYPEDSLAAQVLGFVNADGKGQYGAEGYYDEVLVGRNGLQGEAQNATGQAVSLGGKSFAPPEDGDTVVLTIDRNVQYQAEQALEAAVKQHKADGGSLIVMSPQTGAIVAMANRPTFDPNRYGAYPVESYTNGAISGSYEPGSTFKTITMASALDTGAVTPSTIVNGTASIKVGDRELFNSVRRGYGPETTTQVIERSDNVGMVQVEQLLGSQRFYDYVKRFGFGTPAGVELAGEITPPLTAFSELNPVDFAAMSFGQGISVTPIQLLTAVNSFANQGKLIQPYVVEQIQRRNGKVEATQPRVVRQVVSPQAASQITGMMVRVVETGAGRPANVPGYRLAGKTGTAQIAKGGIYDPNSTIGNFVGFGPVENPQFIMLVKIDRPKDVVFAEESAAPTFGQMAKFLFNYYNVPPSK